MFRAIFKFLASLQFAILLLVVIIVASIVGTIYETSFNADVAQKYIYNAPWFNLWLLALATNLFCVAAIRYPWKRHQTGFVITHAGIITLLFGSMIDRLWGVEGFVHLYSTRPGTKVMELHEQKLSVKIDGKTASTTLKVNTLWNARPLESPDPEVKVEIKDVQPVVASEIAIPVENGQPALNFTLQGSMMGRNDMSIFLNDKSNMGPATVAFLKGMPKARGGTQDASAELTLTFQDKSYSIPVKMGERKQVPLEGRPGWKVAILGYYSNFRLQDGRPINLNNNPENPAVVFELIGPPVLGVVSKPNPDDPHSQGANAQDPEMGPQKEGFFVFARNGQVLARPEHGPATGAQAKLKVVNAASPIDGPSGVAFYLGDDGKLRYLIKQRKKGMSEESDDDEESSIEKTGEIELEKPVAVGWAPGAEVVVHEFLPSARGKIVFNPRPKKKSEEMDSGNTGLKCRATVIKDGKELESKELWVGQTTLERIFKQELSVAGKTVGFEFVNEAVNLPFTVGLKKFNARLDEGISEKAGEFSAFESVLSFAGQEDTVWLKKDSETAKELGTTVVTGAIIDRDDESLRFVRSFGREVDIRNKDIERQEILTQKISMNEPTIFPRTWYGPFIGTSYKFSQANHHWPEEKTYSGVQVLYDPGWFFKWVGCVMICFGIFTMFYLRPYFNRPKVAVASASAVVVKAGSKNEKAKGKKKPVPVQ